MRVCESKGNSWALLPRSVVELAESVHEQD
jgi:hypothetical protein